MFEVDHDLGILFEMRAVPEVMPPSPASKPRPAIGFPEDFMSDEGKGVKDVDIATAAGAAKAANFFVNLWMQLWRKKGGTMSITSPQNRQPVDGPWVPIRGTHTAPTDAFWLMTYDGDEYWPQGRIRPLPDGQWQESVNVNEKPHERDVALVPVKTNPFCNKVLEEWRKKCGATTNWDPITLPTTPGQLEQVQGIVLHVKAGKAP